MRKHLMVGALALVTVATMAAPRKAEASVIFQDSTFVLTDYQVVALTATSPNTIAYIAQCQTCGNPGQAMSLEVILGDTTPQTIAFYAGAVNASFVYNPSTQGAITSIDGSTDKNFTVAKTTAAYNNSFRIVVEQNGKVYTSLTSGPGLAGAGTTGYVNIAATGLVATDFTQIDPSTGAFTNGNPDFSATGTSILFGVAQLFGSNGTAGADLTVEYDNLVLTVNQVPEPGTIALFATAAIILGGVGVMRRRQNGGSI